MVGFQVRRAASSPLGALTSAPRRAEPPPSPAQGPHLTTPSHQNLRRTHDDKRHAVLTRQLNHEKDPAQEIAAPRPGATQVGEGTRSTRQHRRLGRAAPPGQRPRQKQAKRCCQEDGGPVDNLWIS
jgi:hypothetical protein